MSCCKKRSLAAATTRDDGSSSSSSMAPEDPLRQALSAARRTTQWRRHQLLRAVQQGRPAPTDHSSGGGPVTEGRVVVFPSSSPPSRRAGEEQDIAAEDIERRLEAVLGRFKKQLQGEQSTARTRRFEQYGSFLVPEANKEPPTTSKRATLPQKEAAEAGGFSSCWNPARVGSGKRVFPDQHPASAGGRGATLVRCPRPPTGTASTTTTNGGKGGGAALEKRLEAVLGDRRRRFESGKKITASNLSAMFGQYGTFL